MTHGNLTARLESWYPDLFDPATVHAEDYVGYPEVQNSILLERDLRSSIGNLVARAQFVALEEERLAA